MGKQKKPEKPKPSSSFPSPFAALGALPTALLADRPVAAVASQAPPEAAPGPARAVVRMERKGRGGKEVTVVEKLELSAVELEVWLRALKHSLGCGGAIDGEDIVLQGDFRERLPSVLTGRGVRKVIIG